MYKLIILWNNGELNTYKFPTYEAAYFALKEIENWHDYQIQKGEI